MTGSTLSVAVPWSLTHYLPLNGFHPLYRALFDSAPAPIEFCAWDNVKLHNRLASDDAIRQTLLASAAAAKDRTSRAPSGTIGRKYLEYFWPPNQALTQELCGDIEFQHTAPYPSLRRPFVFHCESFAPVFLPFVHQGGGDMERHRDLREHYRRIFASPLCLGIHSHIPETLDSLRQFFDDPVIDGKLFRSRIGLSARAVEDGERVAKPPFSRPKFLFVNSANQNPHNFFRRGGHVVLRFWKEFIASGHSGLLLMRCARPSDEDLAEHGVDEQFVHGELGRSILWAEDYLANHEMNALMASAHFFLLPSVSLHSASTLQAMSLGTVPVVTDTVGTSVYVSDNEQGIVLHGVREAVWRQDPNTGVLVDRYHKSASLDDSLVRQLSDRILSVLSTPSAYERLRDGAETRARTEFSGEAFSSDFWGMVGEAYARYQASSNRQGEFTCGKMAVSLRDCYLQGKDWARVFESATQPMLRIDTGRSVVWELGGTIVHAYGRPRIDVNDWSVLAPYYTPGSPETTFANTIDELGGKYLGLAKGYTDRRTRRLISLISRLLMPFPRLHSWAARVRKKLSRLRRRLLPRPADANQIPDIELVLHGVSGYNIIRSFNEYFAVPQGEGEFVLEKAKSGGYSSCFMGYSVAQVVREITAKAKPAAPRSSPAPGAPQPILAEEGWHGFNIIQLGDQFHAILQCEGAFEVERIAAKGYSRSFSGNSLAEVRAAIAASVALEQAQDELEAATAGSDGSLMK